MYLKTTTNKQIVSIAHVPVPTVRIVSNDSIANSILLSVDDFLDDIVDAVERVSLIGFSRDDSSFGLSIS